MVEDDSISEINNDKYTTEITNDQRKLIREFYKSNPDSSTHVHINGDSKAYLADDIFFQQLKMHNELLNFSPRKRMFNYKISNSELIARWRYFEKGEDSNIHAKKPMQESPLSAFNRQLIGANSNSSFHIGDIMVHKDPIPHYEWMVDCLSSLHHNCSKNLNDLKGVNSYFKRRSALRRRDFKETEIKIKEVIRKQQDKTYHTKQISPIKKTAKNIKIANGHRRLQSQGGKETKKATPNKNIVSFFSHREEVSRMPSPSKRRSSYVDKLHNKYMHDLKQGENMDMFYYKIEASSLASTLASSPSVNFSKHIVNMCENATKLK